MIAFPENPSTDPNESSHKDPSSEEIERRAAEIRRGWSVSQVKRRRVAAEQAWVPQTVSVSELAASERSAEAN